MRAAIVLVAALTVAATAVAAGGPQHRVLGTSGDDTLVGTAQPDHVLGYAGNDDAYGGAGADELDGGPGLDRLFGGDGRDLVWGGHRGDPWPANRGYRREWLLGGGGEDVLGTTMPGAVFVGGDGSDQLHPRSPDGSCRFDLNARRRVSSGYARCVQTTIGGRGDDRVWARDGNADWISCGPGRDAVHDADRIDYVGSDCERVKR